YDDSTGQKEKMLSELETKLIYLDTADGVALYYYTCHLQASGKVALRHPLLLPSLAHAVSAAILPAVVVVYFRDFPPLLC
ncbi:MAG: hypothetical protein IJP17_08295, partial [Clostridia bacterium]|nr:hypothetical protein [Clostridia bacterium]